MEEPPTQVPFAKRFTARLPGQEGLGVDPMWTVALPLPGRGHERAWAPREGPFTSLPLPWDCAGSILAWRPCPGPQCGV